MTSQPCSKSRTSISSTRSDPTGKRLSAISISSSSMVRRLAWWASPVAGSPPWPWRSCTTCLATEGSAADPSDSAGRDFTQMGGAELRQVRVNQISMVYQDPSSALNPSIKVGRQVGVVFDLMGVPKQEHERRTIEVLEKVQIADPSRVIHRYPHQLSGGMLQRVVIAMAIASRPALLVLDEPTTGLDATVEAEVLDLVSDLRDEIGTSVLFISHNLAVIRKMCDRTAVLYAGRMMAEAPTESIFTDPRHPYTVGLLRCLPSPDKGSRDRNDPRHHPWFSAATWRRDRGMCLCAPLRQSGGHLHRGRARSEPPGRWTAEPMPLPRPCSRSTPHRAAMKCPVD